MLTRTTIILSMLLLAIGTFVFSNRSSASNENTLGEQTALSRPAIVPIDDEDTLPKVFEFNIVEGTASYSAQKIWFNKPMESVIGTTTDVSGNGWFDKTDGSAHLEAQVDLSKLDSGSKGRDSHIKDIFINSTDASVVFDLEESDIKLNEEFTITVPATFTINNVTKELPITIEGLVTPEAFSASGKSEVLLLEDFELVGPTYAGIFSVGEEASFMFEVAGSLVQ